MKKLLATVLTIGLLSSFSTVAMATTNNGQGKGLANAPGQADNFSKGITTEVTTSVNVVQSTITDTQISDPAFVSSVPMTETTSEVIGSTSETTIQNHPVQIWHREVTEITTESTITTTTWDEITIATTTTVTETPVTTTETTVVTNLHHGAPISNGKEISNDSVTTIDVTYGTPIVVSSTIEYDITDSNVTTNSDITSSTVTTNSEWYKEDGTPSTQPQGNK